ncbi:MAG: amidohydrolase, partial [Deltaproteobacteria bacterium]
MRRAARRGTGWLRGVAYHESVAGPLDRERLDAWVADRPLRVQHRSGAQWVLNSAGVAELERAGTTWPDAAERDARGRLTGRLFRADAWLRERLGGELPDLAPVGARLASYGVTGITDASAANDRTALGHLSDAAERGALPQQLLVMGAPDLPEPACARAARGAVKVLLDDPQLPDFSAFCAQIRAAHAASRAFAVHCVTR